MTQYHSNKFLLISYLTKHLFISNKYNFVDFSKHKIQQVNGCTKGQEYFLKTEVPKIDRKIFVSLPKKEHHDVNNAIYLFISRAYKTQN